MPWIDPGEFGRGAAAREDARADRERAALDELLAAGWNRSTADEARRLQAAAHDALVHSMVSPSVPACDETAMELVGEARGRALAEWWARSRHLDDETRRLLAECAAMAASLALVDGYRLGVECARGAAAAAARPVPSFTRVDGVVAREPVRNGTYRTASVA